MMKEYFAFDNLSNFVGLFVVFFSVIVTLYSFAFMKGKKGLWKYYLYVLLTTIASLGVVFASHLIVLIIFWGFLGFLLYLLIGFGEGERTSATAKKTFIIIGGTDAIMLLGLALIWRLTGTFNMEHLTIPLSNKAAIVAYLALAIGAFA
ncbi:MAG: hypothetical protein JW938_03000, partial [Candidatus Omnitrophica bacterium]|nr:hypothetical protein [Candidatus Omnitrophota bacterium]